jgi:hypothetical protein
MIATTIEYRDNPGDPIKTVERTFPDGALPAVGDLIQIDEGCHFVRVRIFKPIEEPGSSPEMLIGCLDD